VPDAATEIRAARDDEWPVVAWLWQLFRHDLALVVDGRPYADGRYQHGLLDTAPSPDLAALLALQPHPKTGEQAPVGFAVVDGLTGERRSIAGFWTAPVVRRTGVGRALAVAALSAHPGPWRIGFQHDNTGAGAFWRRVADQAFGPRGWTEVRQPVPGLPDVPPDHLIDSR